MCRQLQIGNAIVQSLPPPIQEQYVLLRDWFSLHYYAIKTALAPWIYQARSSFDYTKYHAEFFVLYQPESAGNPSTAFRVTSTSIKKTPASTEFDILRDQVEGENAQAESNPKHAGYYMCICEQSRVHHSDMRRNNLIL